MEIFKIVFQKYSNFVLRNNYPAKQFSTCISNLNKMDIGGNIKINYISSGSSGKSLIFLPGALGTIETDFKPQLTAFQKFPAQAVFWDPPGYGKSRPPQRDFSPGFFQRDCQAAINLMKKLGHQKFSVCGWSDGGITALMMAQKAPECIDKIVIWGGNAFIGEHDLNLYEKVRDVSNWSEKMRKPMEEIYGVEEFATLWGQWVDALKRIFNEENGVLYSKDLSSISVPTLIIHGKKDPMVGFEQPSLIHEKINNSRLIVWEQAKHNLHLRYPDEFNKLIWDFLNE